MSKLILIFSLIFSVLFLLGCTGTEMAICGDGICSEVERDPTSPYYCPQDCEELPVREIGNSLSSVRTGGSVLTRAFTLNNGDIISSFDFIGYGFDPRSINFGYKMSLDRQGAFEINSLRDGSVVNYVGLTPLPSRARVICQLTQDLLEDILYSSRIIDEYYIHDTYCEDAQPCCVVLFERSN